MSKNKKYNKVAELDLSHAAKPAHEQYLDLAKKGFKDPASLSHDEIWHICRAMIFYTAQLDKLL